MSSGGGGGVGGGAGAGGIIPKPNTKDKLKSIVDDFDHFDSEMKIGTRV